MRIICDKCMVDAEVSRVCHDPSRGTHDGLWHIRCHGEEHVISCSTLPDDGATAAVVHVWSNLKAKFHGATSLMTTENEVLNSLFELFSRLRIYHRVRRAQNGKRIYSIRENVDEAIDTLLLYRKDGKE